MAANGLVKLVEDRPAGEEVLVAEDLLDRPELLVAQHGLQRIELGIGAQHEDAVELAILLGLGAVDGEVAFTLSLEEASVAGPQSWCGIARVGSNFVSNWRAGDLVVRIVRIGFRNVRSSLVRGSRKPRSAMASPVRGSRTRFASRRHNQSERSRISRTAAALTALPGAAHRDPEQRIFLSTPSSSIYPQRGAARRLSEVDDRRHRPYAMETEDDPVTTTAGGCQRDRAGPNNRFEKLALGRTVGCKFGPADFQLHWRQGICANNVTRAGTLFFRVGVPLWTIASLTAAAPGSLPAPFL